MLKNGGLIDWCEKGAASLGIKLTEEQGRMFNKYYQLILRQGKRVNLTSILQEKEAALKHFVDSLTCLLAVSFSGCPKVVDVGTGAGLPGIPLKIARPRIKLTLIDASLKKVAFLSKVVRELDLKEVNVIHGRAEDLACQAQLREKFDYALSRALAPLPVLLEYCLGFIKTGGFMIALKGPASLVEEEGCRLALTLLGGALREVKELSLPYLEHRRRLVLIEKVSGTPADYPRRAGVPFRHPL